MDSSSPVSAVSSLKVCSWLMDFGPAAGADLLIEPAARVQAVRLAGQRQAPLAEALFQERFVEAGQVAHLAMPEGVQVLLHHLAHARNFAHVERRQEAGLLSRHHPQHAVGLGLVGGDLGHQARGGNADRAVQLGFRFHRLVQQVGGARAAGLAAARCRVMSR